jgi:hypothetical protein
MMIQDSDARPPGKKKWKIWDAGPAWIAAIAALLTAMTGAGFFVGRVSAAPVSAPLTVMVTQPAVTVTVGAGCRGARVIVSFFFVPIGLLYRNARSG